MFPPEDSPSGLGRTLGKRVGGNPSRVRISYPPHPPWPGQTKPPPGSPVGGFVVAWSHFWSHSAPRARARTCVNVPAHSPPSLVRVVQGRRPVRWPRPPVRTGYAALVTPQRTPARPADSH